MAYRIFSYISRQIAIPAPSLFGRAMSVSAGVCVWGGGGNSREIPLHRGCRASVQSEVDRCGSSGGTAAHRFISRYDMKRMPYFLPALIAVRSSSERICGGGTSATRGIFRAVCSLPEFCCFFVNIQNLHNKFQ